MEKNGAKAKEPNSGRKCSLKLKKTSVSGLAAERGAVCAIHPL